MSGFGSSSIIYCVRDWARGLPNILLPILHGAGHHVLFWWVEAACVHSVHASI